MGVLENLHSLLLPELTELIFELNNDWDHNKNIECSFHLTVDSVLCKWTCTHVATDITVLQYTYGTLSLRLFTDRYSERKEPADWQNVRKTSLGSPNLKILLVKKFLKIYQEMHWSPRKWRTSTKLMVEFCVVLFYKLMSAQWNMRLQAFVVKLNSNIAKHLLTNVHLHYYFAWTISILRKSMLWT